ncbi:MAG: 5-exo-hydroxycamphor dehydrogenase [Candidatus Heimdallarchaeota archaeon LC_2]|nr:MAG: 5-exo-hydroxycamphor dehydrogenase [Candidatus Heimdallarchaeota archaeon LC_2]
MVKSVHLNSDGSTKIVEMDTPSLEIGAILIRTLYSEVCGTDVHLQDRQLTGVPYPIIPGHVSTGIIKDLNGTISDIDGKLLRRGDKVTFLDVHETCNSCWYCLVAKETTRCPKRKVYGITYSAKDGLLGGWSQYIYLKPGVKVIRLPENLDPKIFMAGGCGLPTAIHGIQRAEIKLGDTVVIQGSGPVGMMAAILAFVSGAFRVIVIGGPQLRLTIVKEFGISEVLNIDQLNEDQRLAKILELTNNRGADVVIEATGVPSAVREGMKMARDGGTYVVLGQYTDAGDLSINPHNDINKKHLTIKGCWGSDFSHFYLGVKFMTQYQDKYPWEKIISREYSLEEAAQALDDVRHYKIMKALIDPFK